MRVESLDSPIPVEWILPKTVEVPPAFRVACGGHPIVAEIAWRRGLRTEAEVRAFLDPDAYSPTPADELPDLAQACEAIMGAIAEGERILVWGDFDVDGQSATSVLVSGLRLLGAKVSYYVPDRARESHGLNLSGMYRAHQDGVGLLLTCDCGVSNSDEIRWFREHGGTVVVTDHHELPAELPPADAVVDNKRLSEGHPLRDLAGVGVAYKLMEALLDRAGKGDKAGQLLDLVALGIVADVVPQHHDNRYLLQLGLKRLTDSQRPGVRALLNIATRGRFVTAETIGFGLGPRLNAAGRLADASAAVRLLLTEDETEAEQLAQQLDEVNQERRDLTTRITQEAIAQVDALSDLDQRACLVLSSPGWHPGVVGIVANQIAERYARPTVMLVPAEEGNIYRGSARSFGGVNLYEALLTQAPLLATFGGHAFAAGMSLSGENLDRFRKGLNAEIARVHDPSKAARVIPIDAVVELESITPGLAQELARLGPFGQGNPSPNLLVRDLLVTHRSTIGAEKHHLRLTVENDDGVSSQITWWRHGQANKFPVVSAVVALGIELEGDDLAVEITAIDIARGDEKRHERHVAGFEILDLRMSAPWSEDGLRIEQWPPTDPVEKGGTIVLCSVPPSLSELRELLRQVRPSRVVIDPIPEFELSAVDLVNRFVQQHRDDLRSAESVYDLSGLVDELGSTIEIARRVLDVVAKKLNRPLLLPDGQVVGAAGAERALTVAVQERRAFSEWFGQAPAHELIPRVG